MNLINYFRKSSEDFKSPLAEDIIKNKYENILLKIVSIIAISFSLFQLYTAYNGVYLAIVQRSVHLAFVMAIGFILFPIRKKKSFRFLDVLFALLTAGSCIYLVVGFEGLIYRQGSPNFWDLTFGIIILLGVLELGRRVIGWTLPLLCVLGIVYALFGKYLPGIFSYRGLSLKMFINTISLSNEGIFGLPLGVSSTYVFIFVLFGTFLSGCGGGLALINLAKCLVGNVHAGAGKAAIVGSALFGSISGSAVANVMATGTLTIPMMKKLGYPDYFAAGVVAVASTGGTIMPPVMGAIAFIAAEFMQVTYAEVALAAAIPAILYYAALFVIVDLRARRLGLKRGYIEGEKPLIFKKVLLEAWIALVPISVLLYYLMFLRKSALLSSFWATVSIMAILFVREKPSEAIKIFIKCLRDGGKNAISVAMGCALAGIIMGVLTKTGVAMKLSTFMVGLAGDSILLLLCLSAIISLILGMGVTAAIAYIIPAMMVVPILVKAGIPPMAANIFVMYFSVISYVTPPVALASYAAASVAEADMWKTGWTGFKMGVSGLIIPFMLVYGPALVLVGTLQDIIWSSCTAFLGICLLGCSIEGWFKKPLTFFWRFVIFVAALLLVKSGWKTDLAGISLTILFLTFQYLGSRGIALE